MVTFKDLEEKICGYIHHENDLNLIRKAYELANDKHKGPAMVLCVYLAL